MADAGAKVDFDVVIIGAGISGINQAYWMQKKMPELSYTVLEARDNMGGTWDLFKYPGIRSDSDLYTYGFSWAPWNVRGAIAEGSAITKYLKESSEAYGISSKIRYRHRVKSTDWSSASQTWEVSVDADGKPEKIVCHFIVWCTGYYDYEKPLDVFIPGIESFKGPVIHPQFWPEDLDYENKQVVIIGSGATAVTLLPNVAKKAAHVTMLQRSPSYVMSQPSEDGIEWFIRTVFPSFITSRLIRMKWLFIPWLIVSIARISPNTIRNLITKEAIAQLPPTMKIDPHFNPKYNPFEQRVCFCPDGDFYKALREGKASVATGIIDTVTPNSIKLKSGQELTPDIIVTATGLRLQLGGGVPITVDNEPYLTAGKFFWKFALCQDLPNAAFVIGYVDAAWTLAADTTAYMLCRLWKQMRREDAGVVVPRAEPGLEKKELPFLNLTSTYVTKAKDVLPRAADAKNWQPRTYYLLDMWRARFGDLKTGAQYIKGSVW
ncbi:FAD/NAD(P)-binding domain-containing protein [Trichodelitschia bisporula]|uniref:FAD/NAD(P)-binding domain-containing protein n=1 Tax=Trichodelitschia bisporula TaxID=703511 RepID=A0A6G1HUQ5_9PEZI|nr:FAD/NAD(P)-binding domain-containing protein [Trichodelitschia bisporula]